MSAMELVFARLREILVPVRVAQALGLTAAPAPRSNGVET